MSRGNPRFSWILISKGDKVAPMGIVTIHHVEGSVTRNCKTQNIRVTFLAKNLNYYDSCRTILVFNDHVLPHFQFNFFSLAAYCHGKEMLSTLCSLITGDALLYSMFRENAKPVSCPFKGPFTFTYSRGHGECSSPVSSIDTCTDDSRLLLSYQACPDIHGTESTGERKSFRTN